MIAGSLLNATHSETFLWSSADFTLPALWHSLDLFCRSTQLARYLCTEAHSPEILLLNLGLTSSLLVACGVLVFLNLLPPIFSLPVSDSHHLGDLAQGLEQHDVPDAGRKPAHFV